MLELLPLFMLYPAVMQAGAIEERLQRLEEAVLLSLDLFVFPSAFMLLLKRLMTAVPAVQGPVASAITTALNNSLQPSHLEGCTPPR